jgi:DNA-binding PadR family transcriptional regulator
MPRNSDWFSEIFAEFNPERWGFRWDRDWGRPHRHRRRAPMFESGDMKHVILSLLREKPRHGYEIIKALEERMGGCYTPSAGTVYPTLQMLEDQGLVRAVETEGKRVYHITAEGEAFLEQHRDVLDEILGRVRETLRDVAGGTMGELNEVFARLAAMTYKEAWRRGPDDPRTRKIIDVLRRAADEIRALREAQAG